MRASGHAANKKAFFEKRLGILKKGLLDYLETVIAYGMLSGFRSLFSSRNIRCKLHS